MKTLYINISCEDYTSNDNVVVIGSPEDALINDFYYALGEEIIRGVDFTHGQKIERISVVRDFVSERPNEASTILEQWESVKKGLFSENPRGSFEAHLPNSYIKWLKNHGNTTFYSIYNQKYYSSSEIRVSIDLGELYEESVLPLLRKAIKSIQKSGTASEYDDFVINDKLVTRKSAVVRYIKKQFPDLAFLPFEKFEWNDIDLNNGSQFSINEEEQDLKFSCQIDNIPLKYLKDDYDVYLGTFSDGMITVEKNKQLYLYDVVNKSFLNCKYDSPGLFEAISVFNEGLINVKKSEKWGYIDINNNKIIPFAFDKAYPFHEGRACVMKNGHYGWIDKSGKIIIPYEYETRDSFKGGYICAKKGGIYYLLDLSGRIITKLENYGEVSDQIIVTLESGHLVFRSLAGDVCFQSKENVQHTCYQFQEGYLSAKSESGWGLLDTHGNVVVPFTHKSRIHIYKGYVYYLDEDGAFVKSRFVQSKGEIRLDEMRKIGKDIRTFEDFVDDITVIGSEGAEALGYYHEFVDVNLQLINIPPTEGESGYYFEHVSSIKNLMAVVKEPWDSTWLINFFPYDGESRNELNNHSCPKCGSHDIIDDGSDCMQYYCNDCGQIFGDEYVGSDDNEDIDDNDETTSNLRCPNCCSHDVADDGSDYMQYYCNDCGHVWGNEYVMSDENENEIEDYTVSESDEDSYDTEGNPISKYFEINGIVLGQTGRSEIISMGGVDDLGFEMPDGTYCSCGFFNTGNIVNTIILSNNGFPQNGIFPAFYKHLGFHWLKNMDNGWLDVDHWVKEMSYLLEHLGFKKLESSSEDEIAMAIFCKKYGMILYIKIFYDERIEFGCLTSEQINEILDHDN